MVQFLLDEFADINAVHREGARPIDIAVDWGIGKWRGFLSNQRRHVWRRLQEVAAAAQAMKRLRPDNRVSARDLFLQFTRLPASAPANATTPRDMETRILPPCRQSVPAANYYCYFH